MPALRNTDDSEEIIAAKVASLASIATEADIEKLVSHLDQYARYRVKSRAVELAAIERGWHCSRCKTFKPGTAFNLNRDPTTSDNRTMVWTCKSCIKIRQDELKRSKQQKTFESLLTKWDTERHGAAKRHFLFTIAEDIDKLWPL